MADTEERNAQTTVKRERPQYVYLYRASGAWQTLLTTATPSSQTLQQLGVPQSLMLSSDATAVLDTWTAQLQDPRGEGLDGYVVVDGIVGNYARVQVTPADPTLRDGFTAFLKRENGSWKQLTGGTAFDAQTFDQFGIPPELRASSGA
jgi:hypothetical protein